MKLAITRSSHFRILRSPNFKAHRLKNFNEKLFKFDPWCIAYTLNNPFILNLTAIQQMATLLLPLTMAGTYGRIREICSGFMRAHRVYMVNLQCYVDVV